jgi:hypothetical protein
MSDQHQVISIIATAIGDARKDHPDDPRRPNKLRNVSSRHCPAPDFGLRP